MLASIMTVIQHADSGSASSTPAGAPSLSPPLQVAPEEFRRVGHALVDTVDLRLASRALRLASCATRLQISDMNPHAASTPS